MNDYLVIEAIRKLPRRFVTPGVDITRFSERQVVAAHPDWPAMFFDGKKWCRLTMRQVNKR